MTAVVTVLLGAAGADAQGLVAQKALSAEMAQELAQGALDKCRAQGYRVSVTVVNAEGLLKAFIRDDGAAPHTIGSTLSTAATKRAILAGKKGPVVRFRYGLQQAREIGE
jgi:uncharacterized protein GlcG (DUF336 family)